MPKTESNDAISQPDEVNQAVARIFGHIRDNSVATSADSVSWIAPERFPNAAGTEQALAGPQFYDGISGIGLFLAAYYFASKRADVRDLALRCALRLRLDMQSDPVAKHTTGTGGLVGPASVLYPLVRLADWLKMPELLESAQELATAITPGQILEEDRLDVMGGCAGTLLALLSFIEEVSAMGMDTGIAMDLAILCGRRLLENRISYKSGPRAWPAAGSPPASGFGHGAAGIAYALVRLFQHTGQEEFRDAAIEGFAFERSLYLPELQTWYDPRSQRPLRKASWCEGAPGIALGLLHSVLAVDSHALRHDLEQALTITRFLPASPLDHLCCGNFGRVEIMNIAGSITGRLQLTEHARELARQVLEHAAASGFRFHPHDQAASRQQGFELNPSLFLGLSGIGYTLLRLSYPDLFPSFLMLETQS